LPIYESIFITLPNLDCNTTISSITDGDGEIDGDSDGEIDDDNDGERDGEIDGETDGDLDGEMLGLTLGNISLLPNAHANIADILPSPFAIQLLNTCL
jgi:hypothetical protein